jgi:carbonic anhydrase
MPGYRDALIETAVCVNTAQAAYDLHVEVERAGKWEIEVLYAVYNLFTHKVSMPNELTGAAEIGTHLAMAPTNPREFSVVAERVANRIIQNLRATQQAPGAIKANGNGDNSGVEEALPSAIV